MRPCAVFSRCDPDEQVVGAVDVLCLFTLWRIFVAVVSEGEMYEFDTGGVMCEVSPAAESSRNVASGGESVPELSEVRLFLQ